MQKPKTNSKLLQLTLIYPDRPAQTAECDRVVFCVGDDLKGHGGGMCGIHPGHADAVFTLAKGEIEVSLGGECLLRQVIGEGFAKVEKDRVTVVTEGME